MADQKISQLASLLGSDTTSGDLLSVVDISDNTMGASGTNKKMTLAQFQAAPFSAGTVNGVTYLNGFKVLTSGSALTFDGTNLTNSQNTASPIGLVLNNASASTSAGTQILFRYAGSTTTGYVANQFDGSDFNNQYMAAQHHIWLRGASEQMRLTSTGLGIGTSSPAGRLTLQNASVRAEFGETGGANYIESLNNARTDSVPLHLYGLQLQLFTKPSGGDYSQNLTLDSSGNLIQSAPTTPPTLTTNGQMVFNLTSNTNLRVSVRGSDGVTRTANITLA